MPPRALRAAALLLLAGAAALAAACAAAPRAPGRAPGFRVVAFFTARQDPAHISFVHEAARWLPAAAARHGFRVDTTSDWRNLNAAYLSAVDVVVFLDTRPEDPAQRAAFRAYMERGGAWMGFHFAGFALTPSAVPANWGWYHDTLIGAGSYRGNTWRPTPALLRVESRAHPATRALPDTFRSAPNEWYRWERDLRRNPDVEVLLSIHPASFPLGTGPKPSEIWHGGDYPVVWTNRRYRMLYVNMGHDDMDYEHRVSPRTTALSSSFGTPAQDRLLVDALLWLGRGAGRPPR